MSVMRIRVAIQAPRRILCKVDTGVRVETNIECCSVSFIPFNSTELGRNRQAVCRDASEAPIAPIDASTLYVQ